MSQHFTSGGQSIGASTSVLPMNIQGWFPLVMTGLISLQSKGLSRVFSSTIVQKHQFFSTQPSLWSNSHISTLCDPTTGVGSLSLLQGIFPTQESNSGLPYCRQILYQLSHKGCPQEKCKKMGKKKFWWYGPLSAKWCLGWSWLFFQEVSAF